MTVHTLSHVDALESEAVHIFREVAGEFERPVILFYGGKDSIVMPHLALKPFAPAPVLGVRGRPRGPRRGGGRRLGEGRAR